MKRPFLIFLVLGLLGLGVACGSRSATTENASSVPDSTGENASSVGITASERSGRTSGETTGPSATDSAATVPAGTVPAGTIPESEGLPDPEGATRSESTAAEPAVGESGMVSSANPLATDAGLRVLADGGNAFDAAVAVAASLGVVEPMMSGIGGYGATVLYDAESGETRFMGAPSRTPAALDPAAFHPPTPDYLANRQGAAAVSTPGAVNDWEALWEEYGSLRWERLLEPAIRQAEDGFVLGAENAGWISSEYGTFPAHAQEVYGTGGVPLQAGDLLVQEDLGRSLRLISAEGAGAIYGGELGEAMASAAQQNGGFLSVEDLQGNRSEWKTTIGVDYRGNEVVTAPPPNASWNSLTRLGVMSRFDPAALGHNSTAYLDLYARVTEQAYWERLEYAADPEVQPPPLDTLLSESYWAGQAAEVEPALAETPGTAGVASVEAAQPAREHTTHFVVADAEGNVVSMTQTLGNIFGSKVMPEGTGIWLNNSISYARFEPAGNPLDVFPGRYRTPGISPVLVLRDGRPHVALGTHGGYYIPQTTPQMLMNVLDFGMDVQAAISAPRIAFAEPAGLVVDPELPVSVRNELSALGYAPFVDEYGLGNAHGLAIEYGPGGEPVRFTGGADPRGGGIAVGF